MRYNKLQNCYRDELFVNFEWSQSSCFPLFPAFVLSYSKKANQLSQNVETIILKDIYCLHLYYICYTEF